MIKYLSCLCLLVLCASCSSPQAPSNGRRDIKTPPSPPSLGKLDRATMVEIYNDWNGYSDITPILRHYKLRRHNQELIGNAHFAVGGYGAASIRQQSTKKVKIPAPLAQKFFHTLTTTPLKVGTYQPLIKNRDDYPNLMIRLTIEGQQVTFTSQSQGSGNVPWKILIADRGGRADYISNSSLPAQALKLLDPILNNPGIDAIIQRNLNRKKT